MTVLETPALRATSSTAKSGPASRTASTAAATSSSRRARRCSVHRDRRPSVADTPGTSVAVCMCFTVTATLRHTSARRPGGPPDDRHPHYPEEARRSTGALDPASRLGGEEVLRPGRGHRLERADPGRALRPVAGVVDAVRHAAVGPALRG